MNNQRLDFLHDLRENFQSYFIEKDIFEIVHNNFMYNTSSFLFERCKYTNDFLIFLDNFHNDNNNNSHTISDICNNKLYDTISVVDCFQYDSNISDSFTKIYSMLKSGGLFYFTAASTNAVLENNQIKYTHITKKPCNFMDCCGNITFISDSLFGRTIDDIGYIKDNDENIKYYLGNILDLSGKKIDMSGAYIDLSGKIDVNGNYLLCLQDIIDFSNNSLSDLSGAYIDVSGIVIDNYGNKIGSLDRTNILGENIIYVFDYFNPITIDDINNVFNLDEHFSSWNSYYKSESCSLFFWGIKK